MHKANRKPTNSKRQINDEASTLTAPPIIDDDDNHSNIGATIVALSDLGRDALVLEWAKINKRPPPLNLSRPFLLKAVAYKLQENAYGGLKKSARDRLRKIATVVNSESDASSQPNPGTRLLREWHGVTHEVVIEEKGALYRGGMYRSLSEVAQVITGTKWSGPVFFGLRKRSK